LLGDFPFIIFYMKSQEKIILLVLALINFTNIIDVMVIAPMNPLLHQQFGTNPEEFGILVSSYALCAGVSGLLTSFVMDKYDRKLLLLLIYAGFAVGTFFCGLSNSYEQLLIARSITGLFGGVLFGLVMSITSDVIPPERRGMGMGILMTSFSLASTFGVPLGLYLANKYFLQLPFFAIAGVAVLITLMIYVYIPPINSHLQAQTPQKSFGKTIEQIIFTPNQLLAVVFSFLMNFGQFVYIPFLSDYFVSNVGFTTDQLPLIYLVGGVCTFFTAPLVGKMVDKVGRVQILWVFGTLFLIPLYFCTNVGHVSMLVALLLIAAFFITNNGRVIASSTITSMAAPAANRGSFMSFSATINSVGIGLGSYLGGVIITKTPEGVVEHYNVVGYIAIAVGVLVMWLGSRIRNAEGEATHTVLGHE